MSHFGGPVYEVLNGNSVDLLKYAYFIFSSVRTLYPLILFIHFDSLSFVTIYIGFGRSVLLFSWACYDDFQKIS